MPLTRKQHNIMERYRKQYSPQEIAERGGASPEEVRQYLSGSHQSEFAPPAEEPVAGWLFWGAVGLAAITAHVFHPLVNDNSVPQGIAFHFGVMLLWLTALGTAMHRKNKLVLRTPAILIPLGLLLVWAAASLSWAVNPYVGRFELYNWIGGALFFWLMLQFRPTGRQVRLGMELFFYSGILTSLLGIAQNYKLLASDSLLGRIPVAIGPAATFMHMNEAAHYICALIPFGLAAGYCSFRERRYVRTGLCLLGLGISCWYVDLTQSAAAAGGLIGGAVLALTVWGGGWLIRRGFSAKKLAALSGGAVAAGMLLLLLLALPSWQKARQAVIAGEPEETAATFFSDLNVRLASLSGYFVNDSLAHRLTIYANSLAMSADHPVRGVGIGNTFIHYPGYRDRVLVDRYFALMMEMDHIHNDYLQILVELGLVGALLTAVFLVMAAAGCWRAISAGGGANAVPIVLRYALLWCLLCYAFTASFNFPVERTPPVAVVFFALGLLFAIRCTAAGEQGRPVRAARLSGGLVPVGILILLGVGVWRADRAGREYRESELQRLTQALQARQRWDIIQRLGETILENGSQNRVVMNNYMRGLLSSSRPDLGQACRVGEMILPLYPYSGQLLGNYGIALLHRGEYQKAFDCFVRMNRLFPEDDTAQQLLKSAVEKGRLWKEALAFLPSSDQIVRQHYKLYLLDSMAYSPEFEKKFHLEIIKRLMEKAIKLHKIENFYVALFKESSEQLAQGANYQQLMQRMKEAEASAEAWLNSAAGPRKRP